MPNDTENAVTSPLSVSTGSEPIRCEVPLAIIEEIRKMAKSAKEPMVKYSLDLDKMADEATQRRLEALDRIEYLIGMCADIGWRGAMNRFIPQNTEPTRSRGKDS